jgi:hypothetical protein
MQFSENTLSLKIMSPKDFSQHTETESQNLSPLVRKSCLKKKTKTTITTN